MKIPTISDFTGPLTPDAIAIFINNCEDSFDIWSQLHPTPKLSEKSMIQLAGRCLKEPSAVEWWNGNRSRLIALSTFAKFVEDFRKRFMHLNQQLDTLRRFYTISQRERDYGAFAADLMLGHEVVKKAFVTDPITKEQFNQHLVFFADPALIAQVMSKETNADIINKASEELVAYMTKEWDTLQTIRQAAGGTTPDTGLEPPNTYVGPLTSLPRGPLGAQHTLSPFSY